jgi:hypothetical protein
MGRRIRAFGLVLACAQSLGWNNNRSQPNGPELPMLKLTAPQPIATLIGFFQPIPA